MGFFMDFVYGYINRTKYSRVVCWNTLCYQPDKHPQTDIRRETNRQPADRHTHARTHARTHTQTNTNTHTHKAHIRNLNGLLVILFILISLT